VDHSIDFDRALIKKYDVSGPRYTSYPTANLFEHLSSDDYRLAAVSSNDDPVPAPLSIYIHVPFCAKLCFYCACNKVVTKNKTRSELYLARLYREIALQGALYDRDRQVEQLHFGGGTPTFLEDEQLETIFEELDRHFTLVKDDRREFSIEIDPRTTDADRIFKLADMGINRLSLGVQDVEPIVQKAVNRVQSIEETTAVINAARAANFKSISLDLIYGLPHQTIDSFAKTIETVLEFRPDRLAIYNYAHMPELFAPQKRILEKDLPSADDKLQILSNTINRLVEAGYVYIGMDHFALPDDELVLAQERGQLQRNFQGYSTHGHCDLIGLGPSSIGQVGGTFSQNAKDLNEYYDLLSEAKIPIVKGYVSTDDDLLRKEIIQEIMCHHRLRYQTFERAFDIEFSGYFWPELEALKSLATDGLLEFCEGGFNVTSKGRVLLRHVAMIFDAYLKVPGKKARFSKVI